MVIYSSELFLGGSGFRTLRVACRIVESTSSFYFIPSLYCKYRRRKLERNPGSVRTAVARSEIGAGAGSGAGAVNLSGLNVGGCRSSARRNVFFFFLFFFNLKKKN